MEESQCSICHVAANLITDEETIQHNGQPLRVNNLSFFECPQCKEQYCTAEQDKANAEKIQRAKALAGASHPSASFQDEVKPWMDACFGPEITNNPVERNRRFIEEALELVQSLGMSQNDAHFMVDYVYSRPEGHPPQEVGGTLISLAALCLAHGINMHEEGDKELARIWPLLEKIRDRQLTKPKPDNG